MPRDSNAIDFPWETLESIIGGHSAIDVPRLHVETFKEAEDFLECYGYDWTLPDHRAELEDIRTEAVGFINEELLGDEDVSLPIEVAECDDIRVLLLWGSDDKSPENLRQRWTCALLRVMHTVAHCKSHLNEWYREPIRDQIVARFRPHIHHSANGMTLGRGPDAIPLERFEVKHGKPLNSAVMKLLHKVENVATDIFDRIGFRFVTENRFDTLLVVKYLRQNHVVMFANIKPSRSRNTLIDIDWLKVEKDRLDEEIRAGRLNRYQQLDAIRDSCRVHPYPMVESPSVNPFSAVDYHSLQFTCRQLIRIRDPRLDPVRDTLASLGGFGSRPLSSAVQTESRGRPAHHRQFSFFFPFEVQILDQESYALTRQGLASHSEYKRRQRNAVKRRVLRDLVEIESDD